MGLRWADPCTGAKYDASCKSYTSATARMNLQFCKTDFTHVCLLFSVPESCVWQSMEQHTRTSTRWCDSDWGSFLGNRSCGVGYFSFAKSFRIIVFPLKMLVWQHPLPCQQQVRLYLLDCLSSSVLHGAPRVDCVSSLSRQ